MSSKLSGVGLDRKYSQKSRLFLLPLIEIRKHKAIKPFLTYINDGKTTEQDCGLILTFKKDVPSEFYYYERELLDSPCFVDFYETEDQLVYVYHLKKYEEDYKKFLKGQYTKFTQKCKSLINIYWGRTANNEFKPHSKISAYLSPTKATYETFSEELGIPVTTLLEVVELLDPPNIERETFQIAKSKSEEDEPHGGDSVESSLV